MISLAPQHFIQNGTYLYDTKYYATYKLDVAFDIARSIKCIVQSWFGCASFGIQNSLSAVSTPGALNTNKYEVGQGEC